MQRKERVLTEGRSMVREGSLPPDPIDCSSVVDPGLRQFLEKADIDHIQQRKWPLWYQQVNLYLLRVEELENLTATAAHRIQTEVVQLGIIQRERVLHAHHGEKTFKQPIWSVSANGFRALLALAFIAEQYPTKTIEEMPWDKIVRHTQQALGDHELVAEIHDDFIDPTIEEEFFPPASSKPTGPLKEESLKPEPYDYSGMPEEIRVNSERMETEVVQKKNWPRRWSDVKYPEFDLDARTTSDLVEAVVNGGIIERSDILPIPINDQPHARVPVKGLTANAYRAMGIFGQVLAQGRRTDPSYYEVAIEKTREILRQHPNLLVEIKDPDPEWNARHRRTFGDHDARVAVVDPYVKDSDIGFKLTDIPQSEPNGFLASIKRFVPVSGQTSPGTLITIAHDLLHIPESRARNLMDYVRANRVLQVTKNANRYYMDSEPTWLFLYLAWRYNVGADVVKTIWDAKEAIKGNPLAAGINTTHVPLPRDPALQIVPLNPATQASESLASRLPKETPEKKAASEKAAFAKSLLEGLQPSEAQTLRNLSLEVIHLLYGKIRPSDHDALRVLPNIPHVIVAALRFLQEYAGERVQDSEVKAPKDLESYKSRPITVAHFRDTLEAVHELIRKDPRAGSAYELLSSYASRPSAIGKDGRKWI